MNKVVMIHEITPEVLQKDLSGFDIITFDDGLYTQYLNHKHFAKFNKKMIFFISTSIIRPENITPSKYCIAVSLTKKHLKVILKIICLGMKY